MGNLFNALNGLKTNIFGGGNTGKTTPILRKSAIGINEESPVSVLDHDPFAYSSIQYPRNLTTNGGIGHYMLFYVNVQNRSKFQYTNPYGKSLSTTKQVEVVEYEYAGHPTEKPIRKTKIIPDVINAYQAPFYGCLRIALS